MKVRAKFHCGSIEEFAYGHTTAKLSAISGDKGENKDFADATPSGKIEITINKGRLAADVFKPGRVFYLTFEPEDEVNS